MFGSVTLWKFLCLCLFTRWQLIGEVCTWECWYIHVPSVCTIKAVLLREISPVSVFFTRIVWVGADTATCVETNHSARRSVGISWYCPAECVCWCQSAGTGLWTEWFSALFGITWQREGSSGKPMTAGRGYILCYKIGGWVFVCTTKCLTHLSLTPVFDTDHHTVSLCLDYVRSTTATFGFSDFGLHLPFLCVSNWIWSHGGRTNWSLENWGKGFETGCAQ